VPTVPITGTATDPTVWLELDDEENDEEADDSILAAFGSGFATAVRTMPDSKAIRKRPVVMMNRCSCDSVHD
jgi:hypothetical protein